MPDLQIHMLWPYNGHMFNMYKYCKLFIYDSVTNRMRYLRPVPLLVQSLFAVGGWHLRGGVLKYIVSCDRFLINAGKSNNQHLYCKLHGTSLVSGSMQ